MEKGSAPHLLPSREGHLDPQSAVFDAMVEGWASRCRAGAEDVHHHGRLVLMRRFAAFTNEYPWTWTPEDLEAFSASLRSGAGGIAVSTLRTYQKRDSAVSRIPA